MIRLAGAVGVEDVGDAELDDALEGVRGLAPVQ